MEVWFHRACAGHGHTNSYHHLGYGSCTSSQRDFNNLMKIADTLNNSVFLKYVIEDSPKVLKTGKAKRFKVINFLKSDHQTWRMGGWGTGIVNFNLTKYLWQRSFFFYSQKNRTEDVIASDVSLRSKKISFIWCTWRYGYVTSIMQISWRAQERLCYWYLSSYVLM